MDVHICPLGVTGIFTARNAPVTIVALHTVAIPGEVDINRGRINGIGTGAIAGRIDGIDRKCQVRGLRLAVPAGQ